MVILSAFDEYKHKLFGTICHQFPCEAGMTTNCIPDPKGTLTPPGSSPLRADCGSASSYPHQSSPDAPPTPDSAYMMESANHSEMTDVTECDDRQRVTYERLIGARKRKSAKVHKVEAECFRTENTDSGSLSCPVCHVNLNSQHDFTRHIRSHNRVIEDDSGVKSFECGLCQKALSSNSSLDRHMLVHSGERPFRCHICGTHFTTNGNMHRHIRGHYRNGGLTTGSDSGDSDGCSDDRIATDSPTRKRKFEEEDATSYKFSRFSDSDTDDVCCPVCHIDQNSLESLEKHIEKEHPDFRSDDPHFNSLVIPKLSLFPKVGNQHADVESSAFMHCCRRCGISFDNVESWLLHLREHQNSPQYKCEKCDSSFYTLTEFSMHCEKHQDEAIAKENSKSIYDALKNCSPSVTKFYEGSPLQIIPNNQATRIPSPEKSPEISLSRLSRLSAASIASSLSHEEQFSREYRDMKLNGQYPCRLCKEVYANLRKLKSHNLVHMVAPPYQCNLCSFISNDKNTLKEHMKNHKGDTPYECNLCSLSFTTKANCERHIKNIHGKQTREEIKRCMTYTPQDERPITQEKSQDALCHVCSIDCKSKSVLRDHVRSSHPEKVDKPFGCKVCHCSFISSNDALRHIIHSHPESETSESMEGLIERKIDHVEPHDLSSVESLLSLSKFPLQLSTSGKLGSFSLENMPQSSPQPSHSTYSVPHKATRYSSPLSVLPSTVSERSPSYISNGSLSVDEADTPLDLSISKRSESPPHTGNGNLVELVNNEPKDLSSKIKNESFYNCRSESITSDHIREFLEPQSKPTFSNFPMLYPTQLPLHLYPFSSPFFVNPFGVVPSVSNINPNLIEKYRNEMNRELQLGAVNPLLPANSSHLMGGNSTSFQLSALALASAQNKEKLKCITKSEGKKIDNNSLLNLSKSEHTVNFPIKHDILVKKPKQRRYRTERPWKCDLCDKGFTLRSNMERHIKQQHPDIWQNKSTKIPITKSNSLETDLEHENFPSESIEHNQEIKDDSVSNDSSIEPDSIDRTKEDEERELIIDDDDEWNTEDEDKEDDEKMEYDGADLVSVRKLLSTASTQSFPFFPKDSEESDQSDGRCSPSTQEQMLEDAKKSAYSSAPQKQKCQYCERKFPWSSSLVRHIRTHTGQKPYLCPVCHFPFTTKSNCDRHLQRKHPNSPHTLVGYRPYKCIKCPGAAFTSIESLRKHEMFKHERAAALQKDQLSCHVCEASFSVKQEFVDHVHSEECNMKIQESSEKSEDDSKMIEQSFRMKCILCSHQSTDILALKKHIKSEHTRSDSIEIREGCKSEKTKECPISELKSNQHDKDTSEMISKMLDTKTTVIDHLITSKSVAEAAKLLGVR